MNAFVVDTGCANERSVRSALERVGLTCAPVEDPEQVECGEFVVLPGVGSFRTAMQRIEEQDLAPALQRRIEQGAPTLAICVGLQLLTAGSEESPGESGLGIIGATVRRFSAQVRTPHMGWNSIESSWLEPGFAYFANSYRLGAEFLESPAASGWDVATTNHDGRFVAALRREGVLACQFHPELSGAWGLSLLSSWVSNLSSEVRPC